MDTTPRGLGARASASEDGLGRITYKLAIAPNGTDDVLELVAHQDGLLQVVGEVLGVIEEQVGLEEVALGLVNEMGTTTARALADALISECDERDRLAAMKPLERVAYLEGQARTAAALAREAAR